MRQIWIAILAIAICMISGCDQQVSATGDTAAIPAPSAEDWRRFAALHIVFAHQSVGGNLIDGIKTLAQQQNIPLTISESRSSEIHTGLQHFKIGENGNPEGKIDDYRRAITTQLSQGEDIALMKFCFIDFDSNVNSEQLAHDYLALLNELQLAHPATQFVAITAPLTTIQTGPKAWIKKLLGRTPDGYEENARRQRFNNLIRQHAGTALPVFDLAKLESRDGAINYRIDGETVEALDASISSDGGHLNSTGEQQLGGALVHYLATIERKQQ